MTIRESMQYDVVIVGAGPAGLSAAIRLKQLANEKGRDLSVCILEKGSEVGAHIMSGAVLDPKALNELIPDWKDKGSPLTVPVTQNLHWMLTKTGKYALPHLLMPPFMRNRGTYSVSLGNLCRWLAGQAEELGVSVGPGAILGHLDEYATRSGYLISPVVVWAASGAAAGSSGCRGGIMTQAWARRAGSAGAAQIDMMSPAEGTIGTRITILGSGFGTGKAKAP